MDSFSSENAPEGLDGESGYDFDDDSVLQELFGQEDWEHEEIGSLYEDVRPTIAYDQNFTAPLQPAQNPSLPGSDLEVINRLEPQISHISSHTPDPAPHGLNAQLSSLPQLQTSSFHLPQASAPPPSQREKEILPQFDSEIRDTPRGQAQHPYIHLPQLPAHSPSRLEAQNYALVRGPTVPSSAGTHKYSQFFYSPSQSDLRNQNCIHPSLHDLPPLPPLPTVTSHDYSSPQINYSVPSISFPHTNTHHEIYSEAASTQFPSSLSASGQQSPYQNRLLNEFPDPAVPLRIIDKFFNPFPHSLVTVLHRELTPHSKSLLSYMDQRLEGLQKQQEETGSQSYLPQFAATGGNNPIDYRGNNQIYRSDQGGLGEIYSPYDYRDPVFNRPCLAVPEQTPRSQRSGTSTPGSKTSTNRRKQNIKSFDPSKYYNPLPAKPESWVARPPNKPPTLFEYTIHGELIPERRYTDQEITDFIQYHPLHQGIPDSNLHYDSKLILWIQNTPADSKTRYPTIDSAKCRFESCPTRGGTIRTGEFRICFDEQTWRHRQDLNPFHNAAYVHLYCMEKNFNFHRLFHTYRVLPDNRRFAHEPNRAAITRDRASMLDVVTEYANRDSGMMRSKAWNDTGNEWFKYSLTYALTKHHIENVAEHTRRTMDERDGFSIADHLGDLQKRAEYKKLPPTEKKEFARVYRKTAPGVRVRRRDEVEGSIVIDDDDDDAEGDDEDERVGERERGRKRRRRVD